MKLTTEGIIFLATAWSTVTGLAVYCFYKVLRTPKGPDRKDDDSSS